MDGIQVMEQAKTASPKDIKISVVTLVGSDEWIHNGFLTAMANQNIADQLELIVIAMGAEIGMLEGYADRLVIKGRRLGGGENFLQAQMVGARMAQGLVVAFIEDHCIADPHWAEAVFKACRKGWSGVGYAFKNGSPDTYYFKSVFLAEYGFFAHPAKSREMVFCPDTNIAYDRETLLGYLADSAFNEKKGAAISWILKEMGFPIYLESRALVHHRSIGNKSELFRGHFAICRLLGHARVVEGNWGKPRRSLYALAVVLCVPTLQIWRLFRALGLKHPLRRDAFLAIPFLLGLKQFAAIGEAWGYIRGAGDCEQKILDIELNVPRIKRD